MKKTKEEKVNKETTKEVAKEVDNKEVARTKRGRLGIVFKIICKKVILIFLFEK